MERTYRIELSDSSVLRVAAESFTRDRDWTEFLAGGELVAIVSSRRIMHITISAEGIKA